MAKTKSAYAQKLLDPRWQRLRLEILNRDDWACTHCGDKTSTLHVHHGYYEFGKDPWEYSPGSLRTLCESCHELGDVLRGDIRHIFAMLPICDQDSVCDALRSLYYADPDKRCFMLEHFCDLAHELEKNGKNPEYKPQLAIREI